MNVCFVVISDGWGGAESVVYNLAKFLKKKGVTVHVILNQEIYPFYSNLEGIELFNVGYMYHPLNLIKSKLFPNSEPMRFNPILLLYLNEILRPLWFRAIRKDVENYIRDYNIDVIHSHLENSDLLVSWLRNLGIPWIITLHGVVMALASLGRPFSLSPRALYLKRKAEKLKRILQKADKITVVSNFITDKFVDYMPFLKEKSIVIRSGIDLTQYQKDKIKKIPLEGEFNLFFPGGAKFSKGGDIIIEALNRVIKEIPDIHLYIALNVPKNHLIRRLVIEYGLEKHVTFLGFLERDKFKEYLNSADAMIQMYREESFGIVCLEAMALGKPVIAGNTWLPDFVIDEEYGIFTEPTPVKTAGAIKYLYENVELGKKINEKSLRDIQKFDWDQIIIKYLDLYENVRSNER